MKKTRKKPTKKSHLKKVLGFNTPPGMTYEQILALIEETAKECGGEFIRSDKLEPPQNKLL